MTAPNLRAPDDAADVQRYVGRVLRFKRGRRGRWVDLRLWCACPAALAAVERWVAEDSGRRAGWVPVARPVAATPSPDGDWQGDLAERRGVTTFRGRIREGAAVEVVTWRSGATHCAVVAPATSDSPRPIAEGRR